MTHPLYGPACLAILTKRLVPRWFGWSVSLVVGVLTLAVYADSEYMDEAHRWRDYELAQRPVIAQMESERAQKLLTRERYRVMSDAPEDEVAAMVRIAWRESRFNSQMQNPDSTSHGLFGFLKSTCERYGPCGGDPYRQAVMAWDYVYDRYGSAVAALKFHTTPHYVNGRWQHYY